MRPIWLITVNFGNPDTTLSLLSNLEDLGESDALEIAVIDNGSTDNSWDSLTALKEKSELNLNLIKSDKNLFYWAGAKKAIDLLKQKYVFWPEWLIVCNNDISIESSNFVNLLLSLDKDEYPIIAPSITSSISGNALNPFLIKPLSRLERLYWKLYFLNYETSKLVKIIGSSLKKLLKKKISDSVSEKMRIYAPHGACMIFSNNFFLNGGQLDTGFTLFAEELTVAEMARRLNLFITYIPELKIIHHENSSTKVVNKRTLFQHARDSHKYFLSKYLK